MTCVETWVLSPVGPAFASPKSDSLARKSCAKNESPLAAPTATLSLIAQESGWEPPERGNVTGVGGGMLTSEQVILQAPFGHEFINQQPVVTLRAVSNQFDQIRMVNRSSSSNRKRKEKKWRRSRKNQPLLVPLEALRVELLDGDHHAGAGLRRAEGVLVDPALEDGAESSFSEEAVRAEVPGGAAELVEDDCDVIVVVIARSPAITYVDFR
ncbi:unnamed protein product [Spirodela intermedia]|uniref:Uncharacterized protein n=1 Tax=Spirodela intermedia TaxID=51605 RepID=A0A7I8KXS4_SPIIN|nr:unnamed protein product [Spirodela intermedia]